MTAPADDGRGLSVDMRGKVALVTGGTAGIGREVALGLARDGADVALLSRDPEPAEEIIEQIGALGRQAIAVPADMTSFEEVQAGMQIAVETLGKLDVLIGSGSAGLY